uniref:Uncharacterized protein n=1 Tax=Coccidioides posadasii RMSCC 3488 TaxID=454284 RepID=A0A0J6FGB9_COCPO|nr:hypothetical protein CPAG_04277 [Coccidioides posadasii RMSCC 3488]
MAIVEILRARHRQQPDFFSAKSNLHRIPYKISDDVHSNGLIPRPRGSITIGAVPAASLLAVGIRNIAPLSRPLVPPCARSGPMADHPSAAWAKIHKTMSSGGGQYPDFVPQSVQLAVLSKHGFDVYYDGH